MKRRVFVATIGAVLAAPRWAYSEHPGAPDRVRVGVLGVGPRAPYEANGLASLVPVALRDYGRLEGRNITFMWRFADGQSERLSELVAELIKGDVNVIVTATNL